MPPGTSSNGGLMAISSMILVQWYGWQCLGKTWPWRLKNVSSRELSKIDFTEKQGVNVKCTNARLCILVNDPMGDVIEPALVWGAKAINENQLGIQVTEPKEIRQLWKGGVKYSVHKLESLSTFMMHESVQIGRSNSLSEWLKHNRSKTINGEGETHCVSMKLGLCQDLEWIYTKSFQWCFRCWYWALSESSPSVYKGPDAEWIYLGFLVSVSIRTKVAWETIRGVSNRVIRSRLFMGYSQPVINERASKCY